MVPVLLAHGGDPEATTPDGATCVLLAAGTGSTHVLDQLHTLVRSRQQLVQKNLAGVTPLHAAAYGRHHDCVQMILRWLLPVPVSSKSGRGPTREGRGAALQYGKWPSHTPMDLRQKRHPPCIPALESRIAKSGATPLHCAAYHRDTNLMSLLASHMTVEQIRTPDAKGRTAADYARSKLWDHMHSQGGGKKTTASQQTPSGGAPSEYIITDPLLQ